MGAFLTGIGTLIAAMYGKTIEFPLRFANRWIPIVVIGIAAAVFLFSGMLLPTFRVSATSTLGGLYEIFPQVGAGENSAWAMPPGTISYQYVTDTGCRRSGPQGLRLRYDFSQGKQGAWGASWVNGPKNQFDASRFSTLSFWVKGNQGGAKFMVGVKDAGGHEATVESVDFLKDGVSGSEWRQINIPLVSFKSRGVDVATIQNLNIAFSQKHGAGTICIDDVNFQ